MTVSELIADLQRFREEHGGDMRVVTIDNYWPDTFNETRMIPEGTELCHERGNICTKTNENLCVLLR